MIRHICLFTMKPENREANIAEFLRRAETLRDLPMMRAFTAAANAPGAPESNYDVSLVCDFDDLAALNAYQVHPVHRAFADFVITVRDQRSCIDYEL